MESNGKWLKKAIEVLKKNNMKLTHQRLKLLEILALKGHKHPSIMEIYNDLKKDNPTISISTVYNNLVLFKEMGLIDIFNIGNETRVETTITPHINIVNSNYEITDLEDKELLESIAEKIRRRIKYVFVYTS